MRPLWFRGDSQDVGGLRSCGWRPHHAPEPPVACSSRKPALCSPCPRPLHLTHPHVHSNTARLTSCSRNGETQEGGVSCNRAPGLCGLLPPPPPTRQITLTDTASSSGRTWGIASLLCPGMGSTLQTGNRARGWRAQSRPGWWPEPSPLPGRHPPPAHPAVQRGWGGWGWDRGPVSCSGCPQTLV